MTNYNVFKEQIIADIDEVWGFKTYFGKPVKPITVEHAVVSTEIQRSYGLRQVEELYIFTIRGSFTTSGSVEGYLMDKIDLLMQKLSPYSLNINDLPEPIHYAGIGYMNYVNTIRSIDRNDSDKFNDIELVFEVRSMVYS